MIYIAFSLLTLFVLVFAFYQWQYFMLFSPTYHRDENLSDSCEILTIKTKDKHELEGIIYEPQNVHVTLLFFAGRSHDSVGLIDKLSTAYPDTRIISFNYRSYGKSTGEITEKNLLQDGVRIAELVQKNYGDFYLLGFSLGASIASFVASKHKCKGLFLVGAFDSIPSVARSKFVKRGFLSHINIKPIFRYNFPTSDFVKIVKAPTYLFASTTDETVYIENARALKVEIKNLTYYEELTGLTHKELLWDESVTEKINKEIHATTTL